MIVIMNDQLMSEMVVLSNINVGVRRMVVTGVSNSDGQTVIGVNPENPIDRPIIIVTPETSNKPIEISFSEQPYGYPNLATLFTTGGCHVLVETDPHYVSADDYFINGG